MLHDVKQAVTLVMALMLISEARDACNFEYFNLKFTTKNYGSYREGNIPCKFSTIPEPFISTNVMKKIPLLNRL
jgi:hypothetical protein